MLLSVQLFRPRLRDADFSRVMTNARVRSDACSIVVPEWLSGSRSDLRPARVVHERPANHDEDEPFRCSEGQSPPADIVKRFSRRSAWMAAAARATNVFISRSKRRRLQNRPLHFAVKSV